MFSGKLAVRWVVFLIGVAVMSLGISIVTQAGLGTTPISSLPLVASYATGYTFGETTFAINVVMVLLQILLLGKSAKWTVLLQIPLTYVFAMAIDVSMTNTAFLASDVYWQKLLVNIVGTVILGLGIACEVWAKIMMLPGEGLVLAAAIRSRKPFPKVKIYNDITLVVMAVVLSLAVFSSIEGLREGSAISAVLTGFAVKGWMYLLKRAEHAVYGPEEA